MNIAISPKNLQSTFFDEETKDLEIEQKIGKLTLWNYGKDDKKIFRTYVRLLAAALGLKKPISGNWLVLTFYTRILSWILEYLSLSICYCLQFSKGNRDTTTEQETKVYTIHQIQN